MIVRNFSNGKERIFGLFLSYKQPVLQIVYYYQRQMFLALEAAIPNSSWNICSTEITDLVLLNCKTQKDFGCALIIMWWNEKERKITVLENASLRNYDITELYCR